VDERVGAPARPCAVHHIWTARSRHRAQRLAVRFFSRFARRRMMQHDAACTSRLLAIRAHKKVAVVPLTTLPSCHFQEPTEEIAMRVRCRELRSR